MLPDSHAFFHEASDRDLACARAVGAESTAVENDKLRDLHTEIKPATQVLSTGRGSSCEWRSEEEGEHWSSKRAESSLVAWT